MRRKNCLTLIIITMVCSSPFFLGKTALANFDLPLQIPAPTILSTAQIEEATSSQILINGLSSPGYNVIIYINGKYDGKANISQIDDNYAGFSYLSSQFNSNQTFEVMALTQNRDSSQISAPASAIVVSIIEKSLLKSAQINEIIKPVTTTIIEPPTLLTPRQTACVPNPYVSGFSANKTLVRVYIDDKLFTAIPINSNSSSTSFFSYAPMAGIERGQHFVYAIAEDNNGNKSVRSNSLTFCVNNPQIITATNTSADNNNSSLTNTEKISPTSSLSQVSQKTDNKKLANNKHKNLLNILVFIAFVIGLFVWMIFINRELSDDQLKDNEADRPPLN
ncbi:MAG: hypothetical protein PHO56_05305 [Patescibacteria group bacterium]|nr:hypothetical protein [Patescibacteria group bacterium]